MIVNVLFPIDAEAFTYLVPQEIESEIETGLRVLAPFKSKEKVGVVIGFGRAETTERKINLKTIKRVLDKEPIIPANLLKLIKWVGQYYFSTSGMALKNAIPSGLFSGRRIGKPRITYETTVKEANILNLTSEQDKALSEVNKTDSGVFLLHGVTGSGKTEVYIRAIESLPEDKSAIVLVPEIALTAQLFDRFSNCFGNKVAFLHSGLSEGERLSQWWRVQKGEVKIALGVRSAVFAPFRNLGLIVVDEEQEASYKQFEGLKYNARDVAFARAKLENIKVILGSATPSIESFYNAKNGRFKYLELKSRIADKPMPHVEILDMTKESKRTWFFSDKLLNALRENIFNRRQSLIMLNRRGYSPFLLCTDCGYTYKCPACSITLTYHKDTKTLKCHYCGSYLNPHDFCPRCNGTKTRYIGVGTQRVEEELNTLIPEISLKRMDRDTTRKKFSYYRIVKDMEEKKLDVLLGTQMVAKGHDFPEVTLSAVISADVALNLPDFRSSERAFQLFTQLAGRAGRGNISGEVYIQTYEPQHYVFKYVQNHNYTGFYQKEVELRKELSYPPFSKLIRIVLGFKNKEDVVKSIKEISTRIAQISKNVIARSPKKSGRCSNLKNGIAPPSDTTKFLTNARNDMSMGAPNNIQGVKILGPAPAPIEKLRNLWRWHIILKGEDSKTMRDLALRIFEAIKDIKGVRIDVDVDPINLM